MAAPFGFSPLKSLLVPFCENLKGNSEPIRYHAVGGTEIKRLQGRENLAIRTQRIIKALRFRYFLYRNADVDLISSLQLQVGFRIADEQFGAADNQDGMGNSVLRFFGHRSVGLLRSLSERLFEHDMRA